MLGNFHDNVINIECETSSADLYVVDAEGKYIENIAMHSYLESDVIDAINAKYGTNFTNLTMQKVTGIAIGDDYPNWNAYEKIEIQGINVAVYPTEKSYAYIAGKVKGGIFTILASSETNCLIINQDGNVLTTYGPQPTMEAIPYAISRMADNGIEIDQTNAEISILAQGDAVPNWNSYTKL